MNEEPPPRLALVVFAVTVYFAIWAYIWWCGSEWPKTGT